MNLQKKKLRRNHHQRNPPSQKMKRRKRKRRSLRKRNKKLRTKLKPRRAKKLISQSQIQEQLLLLAALALSTFSEVLLAHNPRRIVIAMEVLVCQTCQIRSLHSNNFNSNNNNRCYSNNKTVNLSWDSSNSKSIS